MDRAESKLRKIAHEKDVLRRLKPEVLACLDKLGEFSSVLAKN